MNLKQLHLLVCYFLNSEEMVLHLVMMVQNFLLWRWYCKCSVITTYQLPNPYDISSSHTETSSRFNNIGVTLPDETGNNFGRDIEFNESGLAMFVLISNDTVSSANSMRTN